MKIYPFKIPKPDHSNLVYQEDIELVFYDQLHQHDEIQISYIKKGKGSLLVDDRITNYQEGDIFIIGSNIPHAFKSEKTNRAHSVMLSLFFTTQSFGKDFFNQQDFSEIHPLFDKIRHGIQVESDHEAVIHQFNKLKKASKLERFILLMEVLKIISLSKTSPLSDFVYQKQFSDIDGKRLRTIFDFTIEHAVEPIQLVDIANIANMTKNAFCKYFKKRTNKTYIQFLTEIRIESACRLLQQNKELSIPQVAFSSGFQNISNFNRKFKRLKGITPLQYKMQFH